MALFLRGKLYDYVTKEAQVPERKRRIIHFSTSLAKQFTEQRESQGVRKGLVKSLLTGTVDTDNVHDFGLWLLGACLAEDRDKPRPSTPAESFVAMLSVLTLCSALRHLPDLSMPELRSDAFEDSATNLVELVEDYIYDVQDIEARERVDRVEEIVNALDDSYALRTLRRVTATPLSFDST